MKQKKYNIMEYKNDLTEEELEYIEKGGKLEGSLTYYPASQDLTRSII
jgi:hypothetical protein